MRDERRRNMPITRDEQTMRINKCIELLEQGQPFYHHGAPELSYDAGRETAQTWADMILVDFEHHHFNIGGLGQFMKGLKDGGPTPSGHPTPTVVASVPHNAISVEEVKYNAWQIRHALSTGIHGILHTHARDPEAVKWFVAASRYPFQTIGRDIIPEGLRGGGGQRQPAEIWGLEAREYVKVADPWPMNPNGELLLGLKIEDRHCLVTADETAAVPGIAFAEWGPGDMGMSFGDPDAHDPPYPAIHGRCSQHRQERARQEWRGLLLIVERPRDDQRAEGRFPNRRTRLQDGRSPLPRHRRLRPRENRPHHAGVTGT